MKPTQIALVITLDASKISKKEALDQLETVKIKLEGIVIEEFQNILIIDETHEAVFIDDRYDDWDDEE